MSSSKQRLTVSGSGLDPLSPSSSSSSSSYDSRSPAAPSSSRATKRLSRMTPSEFDTLLSSSSTKHTTLLDETTLGTVERSPSPQSSPERERERQRERTFNTPPSNDEFKRRSMFRSVGNASSPDLASLVRKAREQRALLQATTTTSQEADDDEEEDDGDQEGEEEEYQVESPTKPSRLSSPRRAQPRSPSPSPSPLLPLRTVHRSRSNTSPELSLSEFASSQTSSPPPIPRIFNSPKTTPGKTSTRDREESTTDSISTLSTNASSGFILVPPPPAPPASPPRTVSSTVQALKNQRQGRGQVPIQGGSGPTGLERDRFGNRSTASLISNLTTMNDSSSPSRKKRGNAREQQEDGGGNKLSLGNTMRKTSRFFKKFGGGGSTTTTTMASNGGVPSSFSSSTATMRNERPTTSIESSVLPLPPPVPPIPSTYTSPPRSQSSNMTTPPRPSTSHASSSSPSPDSRLVEMTGDPMLRTPSAGQTSITSTGSGSTTTKSIRRRRSLSSPEKTTLGSSTGSTTTTTTTTGEGDRLRNELRMWRLGVDGVLGTTSQRDGPGGGGGGGGGGRGVPLDSGPNRRPSLPLTTTDNSTIEGGGGGIKMSRNKSSPLPGPRHDHPRQQQIYTEMPSIKLSSPKRSKPTTTTLDDGRQQQYDTLTSIPETSHSRENSSATTIATPPPALPTTRTTSPPQSPLLGGSTNGSFSTLPTSPPMIPTPSSFSSSSSSTTTNRSSNKNPNSRISIVGYPSSASSSSRYLVGGNSSSFPPLPDPSAAATLSDLSASRVDSLPSSSPSPQLSQHSTATTSSSSTTTTKTPRTRESPPNRNSNEEEGTTLEEEATAAAEEEEAKARDLAEKCWTEDFTTNGAATGGGGFYLERTKIAPWLGSSTKLNQIALRYYVEKFEFGGLRLDLAFRKLCGKLYLKGETQQVDRILEQFSKKYFKDNPKSPYSSADVVHAVSYSMLLLNTDLHVVDTTTRMTRQQFVRNTMNAINSQTGLEGSLEQGGGGGDTSPLSPTMSEGGGGEGNVSRKSSERPRTAVGGGGRRPGGGESPAPSTSWSPNQSRVNLTGGGGGSDSPSRAGTGLGLSQRSESVMTVGSVGSNKSVEANLQVVLKDMYNAIRSQPIYQTSAASGASASTLNLLPGSLTPTDSNSRPSLSLSPTTTTSSTSNSSPYSTWSGGMVNRSASRRSGAPSSSAASSQVFGAGGSGNSKRSSVRGFGALLGASGVGFGNGSLDLVRTTSPTPSTSTSLSDEQWSTAFGPVSNGPGHNYHHHNVPTIGFANSLSHTIIREQHEQEDTGGTDHRSIISSSSTISVTDEELALLGAPWAKEGMLERKHYWETVGKRSKDKNWLKAFVVISQGELKMFRFDGGGAGSGGRKAKMGGGDWTSNASNVGSISLIHALCSAMPPPGYSRDRPHCFVLTLPSGGSYFFQAGTPDLVTEWVQTCNYWSARLSREPLSGGVSNVEYGWNKVEQVHARAEDDDEGRRDRDDVASVKSGKSGHSRMSYAGSAFGHHATTAGGANDRMRIEDWKPPNVPLSPSQLGEEAQLEHLKKHVGIVQAELQVHNELRGPMVKLYSSRSSNYAKAVANWERKSQHLLTEIVKWSTYIEALTSAVRLRSIQRGKKEVEAMLKSADADEEEDDDELVSRLSPFDQMPTSSFTPPLPPPPAAPSSTSNFSASTVPKTARTSSDQEERRVNYPSISRTSVGTTSTRGDEFFDSNETTPPAVL